MRLFVLKELLLPCLPLRQGRCWKTWCKALCLCFLSSFVLLAGYVLSVLWRVSLAEEAVFGCSKLIPVSTFQRPLDGPCPPGYPGHRTLTNDFQGRSIVAFNQKINGFQHLYGSALVAFELGDAFASLLFAANEFAEFSFDFDGVRAEDLLDRRKDLVNNRTGRKLGRQLAAGHLRGGRAERVLIAMSVTCMEESPEFLPHFMDQRLLRAPDEASLGCPFLPKRNLFNWLLAGERAGIFRGCIKQVTRAVHHW